MREASFLVIALFALTACGPRPPATVADLSPTNVPTSTATSTPTVSPSPTLTLAASATPTATPSPSMPPTVTATPTPAPTSTATDTPAPAATQPPPPTATPATAAVEVRIVIGCSQPDAPGNDHNNLNEEYVCLENQGGAPADMTGWTLRDEHGWTYTFPAFTLAPGARVLVRTACGSDTATDLYWCHKGAVWNNDGDVVTLADRAGNALHVVRY